MSFITIPVTSGYSTAGYSQPERVSFCVQDDGSGGELLINGLGVTDPPVTNAVDLATYFGTAFRSTPLLRAFRSCASLLAALDQMVQLMEFYAIINTTPVVGMPAFVPVYAVGGGPTDAPYLSILGPGVAGIWRIELRLRHSITN